MRKRKYYSILSAVLALIMMLTFTPLTVFADAGQKQMTVTIKAPEGISLENASANAYLVLKQASALEGGKGVYAVASGFESFFQTAQEQWNDIIKNQPDVQNIYLTYAGSGSNPGHMELTTDPPTSGGNSITIQIDEGSAPETGDGFAASLISMIDDTANDVAVFSGWLQHYAENTTSIEPITGHGDESGKITISVTTPGYYLIVPKNLPSGVIMKTATLWVIPTEPDIEIELKVETPEHNKQVKEEEDTAYSEDTNTEIGGKLSYQLTYKIPEKTNGESWKRIAFLDTMHYMKIVAENPDFTLRLKQGEDTDLFAGSTWIPGSISGDKTFIMNNQDTHTFHPTDCMYSLQRNGEILAELYIAQYDTANQKQVIYLELTEEGLQLLGSGGATLTFTYHAVLTGDAHGINPNEVIWDVDDSIAEDEAKVYTYGIQLTKTYSDGNFAHAAETEFTLYKGNTTNDNDKIEFVEVPNQEGVYRVKTTEDTEAVTSLKPGSSKGELILLGLDEGIYKLVETKAPEGFSKIADTIFTLTAQDSLEKEKLDPDETIVEKDSGAQKDTSDADGNAIDTYESSGKNISILLLKAHNAKGFDLPTTGGAGTWVFTLGGIGLIVVAGGFLMISHRKQKSNKK